MAQQQSDEPQQYLLLVQAGVLENQLEQLTSDVERLRNRNESLQKEIESKREKFKRDCMQYDGVEDLEYMYELRTTKSALENDEQNVLKKLGLARRLLHETQEKKRIKLEGLRLRNKALHAAVKKTTADSELKQGELTHLQKTLNELEKSEELAMLQQNVELLEEEKSSYEDCIIGMRLQYSKIEGETRLLSAQCSTAWNHFQQRNKGWSNSSTLGDGHRPQTEREAQDYFGARQIGDSGGRTRGRDWPPLAVAEDRSRNLNYITRQSHSQWTPKASFNPDNNSTPFEQVRTNGQMNPRREDMRTNPQHEDTRTNLQREDSRIKSQHDDMMTNPQREDMRTNPWHEDTRTNPRHEHQLLEQADVGDNIFADDSHLVFSIYGK